MDGLVLLHRPSGYVYFLNAVAADYWAAIRSGEVPAAAAARIAARHGLPAGPGAMLLRALEREWDRLRLLGAADAEGLPCGAAADPPPASARPCFEAVLAPGPRPVRVRCHLPGLRDWLTTLAAPTLRSDDAAASCAIDLYPTRSGCALARDGVLLMETEEVEVAGWELVRTLWRESHPGERWCALIHGAAAAGEQGAVVLAGTSGAGKSTLNMALLRAGFRFLSDDLVPLAEDGRCRPVPLAMSVKAPGWPVMQGLLPDLAGTASPPVGRLGTRYVWPPDGMRVPAGQGVPVRLVLFPSYRPDAVTRIEPLAPQEMAARLGATGTIYPEDEAGLARFLDWAARTRALAVTYSRLDEVLDVIAAALAEA